MHTYLSTVLGSGVTIYIIAKGRLYWDPEKT